MESRCATGQIPTEHFCFIVGEDGVDDGGDPTATAGVTSTSFNWQNNHVRDWVWPQPATAAEVQYYFEHPPK